ncbi:MAG: type VI secretion system tube protein Hcp [Novosphingobium sp.]
MAQVDFFLKIDGIDGESTDDKHKGEIDVESFSWGVSNGGTFATGGGGGAGKAALEDIHFTSFVSKASPKLMVACAQGKHIKSAVLVVRKAGTEQQEAYTVKLEDVLISSYQSGAHESSPRPTDQFSLNYAKIEFTYKEQKADGSLGGAVTTKWDLKANKGG